MKLHRSPIRYIFNLIYMLTILHGWYTGLFVIYKIRGIYPGDVHESLDFYSSHPLHGIMNMTAACFGMPALTIFGLLGMTRDLQSQSIWVNVLNLANMIFANLFMLTVHEWANAEKTH